jgi:hypothetical protein
LDDEMYLARVGPFELIALPTRYLVRRGLWSVSGPASSIDKARRAAIAVLRAHLNEHTGERIGLARVDALYRALAELKRLTP